MVVYKQTQVLILKFLKSYDLRTYFLVCFTIVGLFTSRAVMSIGVVALFANVLLEFALNPSNIITNLKSYFNDKRLFSLSFIFWVSLFALSYSSEKALGFNFVLNKLPLLVVPLAISLVDDFSKKYFHFLLTFFIVSIFVSSLAVVYIYFKNYEDTLISLNQGQAIWMPFNHIRYSVMLVFAFISSAYLSYNFSTNNRINHISIIFGMLSIFFFVLVHFLAVRSGWLVLYLSIFVWLLYYIYISKKYYLILIGAALMILIPLFAYHNIDSIKSKVGYMKYDWQQYQQNNIDGNSDSKRMISYKIGLKLAKEHFPFGVGTGSIQKHTDAIYVSEYPNIQVENRILPHNEFLYTLIDCGLLGLLALLISIFYPLVSLKNKMKNLFYILFLLIATTPLLYDISLEMQLGITFFALFSSIILKQVSTNEANAENSYSHHNF